MAMSGFNPQTAQAMSQEGQQKFAGLGQLFGGLFGDYGRPYRQAQDTYSQGMDQAQQYMNPFYQAGQQAIPQYQDYLKQMQDPSGYINKLMGGYQESPYAHYQQQQMMRAARNAGSANGMNGSTPMAQFMQHNAQGISSGDMQNYLGNAMGIGQQYGQGLQGMMGLGYGAGQSLQDLQQQRAEAMSQFGFDQGQAKQNQQGDIWGGLGNLLF